MEAASRPPHGGRGLKSHALRRLVVVVVSPPARGAWIEILDSGDTAQTVSAPLPVWGAAFYDYH